MQVNVFLKFVCFTFLFLITSSLQAIELNKDALSSGNDSFLTQFTSINKNISYDGKQFIFYANPSFLYMLGTGMGSAILIAMGLLCINDSLDKQNKN